MASRSNKDKLGSPSTGSDDGVPNEPEGVLENEPEPEIDEPDNNEERAALAPPETEWYHGRLDRYTAEERLWGAARLGSYLVRESDRKPGSYVLSYLGRTGINHFRITAVCGDFYIGGRQFDSLSDLVGYYTHCSDLLKRERLLLPVAPPEPVNDKKVLNILKNFFFVNYLYAFRIKIQECVICSGPRSPTLSVC